MSDAITLLKNLTETNGISGYEKAVRKLMEDKFKSIGADIQYDNIGSVIGVLKGDESGPKIAIAGHMDEIGFIVTKITDDGFIKFQPIGGWWSQVMLAQQYDITTKDGKTFRAVMGSKPPHLLSPEERNKTVNIDDMYLDIGVKNKDEATSLGVRLGDMITPSINFQVMANSDYLLAKAFDNRIGCAIILEAMNQLKNKKHPNIVYGVGTVQEEVGLRGARTTAQLIAPDIVFALDVTVATDTPGLTNSAKLGSGPAILLVDGALIGHVGLRGFVTGIADELQIPYQIDYLARGGTDAGAMHLAHSGAPAMSLCIPSRYIHSHTSMISRSDYENTVRLLVAILEKLNWENVNHIKFN